MINSVLVIRTGKFLAIGRAKIALSLSCENRNSKDKRIGLFIFVSCQISQHKACLNLMGEETASIVPNRQKTQLHAKYVLKLKLSTEAANQSI